MNATKALPDPATGIINDGSYGFEPVWSVGSDFVTGREDGPGRAFIPNEELQRVGVDAATLKLDLCVVTLDEARGGVVVTSDENAIKAFLREPNSNE